MRIRKLIIFLCLALAVMSCAKHHGYKEISEGLYLKLLSIGETPNDSIRNKDFVSIHITYSKLNDSAFYSRKIKFQVFDSSDAIIDKALLSLADQDSAVFIVPARKFFNEDLNTAIPSFIEDEVKLNIKILEHQSYADFVEEKERFLAWANDFKGYESVFLRQYISKQALPTDQLESGIYKILLDEGLGVVPEKGDTVSMQYAGKFLNGKFFDSSSDSKRHFQFVLGTEWQVIKGLESAIKNMKEGEHSLFIMHSDLAFGSSGSSTGIIPPYTSVVFEVKLDRVAKGDSLSQSNVL